MAIRFDSAPDLSFEWMPAAEHRALSRGRITKPETVNYRTFKPEPGGLFDADVFGANANQRLDLIAPAPLWFGHVELPAPIVHPWWLTRELDTLARWCEHDPDEVQELVLRIRFLDRARKQIVTEEYLEEGFVEDFATGAEAIAELVGARPEPVVIDRVLVLPGSLRPLIPLGDGRFATSDVNDLYRRVINRSNRAARLMELNAPEIIIRNEIRMLQEAVESLFDNEHARLTVTGPNAKPLVSVTGFLELGIAEMQLARTSPEEEERAARARACLTVLGLQRSTAAPRREATPERPTRTRPRPIPIPDLD